MFKKLAILALIGTVSSITISSDVSDQTALDAVAEEEENANVQTMVDQFEAMGVDLEEDEDEAVESEKKLNDKQKKKFSNIMNKLDKNKDGSVDYDEGETAYVKICTKKLGISEKKAKKMWKKLF
tara:strand:- start:234 stop:608 length:375 start_codon:yes stop_codon:yes gene_type:complete